MNSPLLLTHFETCDRKGFWSRSREKVKVDSAEMMRISISAGLTTDRTDIGEAAGEACYQLGVDPGIDSEHYDQHGEVIHLACIADIVSTAIRKDKPWKLADPTKVVGVPWKSAAYLDPTGSHLRRVVLAPRWSDDRHYSEARSWFSLGETCAYGLPMQQVVVILGEHRAGKYSSPWTKGLRHPANKKLRFRKKNDVGEPFKDTWLKIWREDFDDISTLEWLQAMLDDGVLQDHCFTVAIDVPEKSARQRILDMAARKLEKLAAIKTLPDPQLTGCDWPRVCDFRGPCHGGRDPGKPLFRILD
jgi:hypothetical protein